jgi:HK97 family phage major capsid protein
MVNAVWAFNSIVGDVIFRFVASGSIVEPQIIPQGRGGPLLGKPFREWSTMAATPTVTGSRIAILGDWSGFKIVDHLGSNVEFIPHIMGTVNNYPIGARGLYYYWRCGSGVVKANAFRYLEVK